MPTIADILLRVTSHGVLSTKGSDLTYAEGDSNFIIIYEALAAMNNGAGLAPFNPLTEYTGTVYVSYSGNIYVHVSGTPTTGVTPGTDPSVWQLSSIGAFAHAQNTDTSIGQGTANESTHLEIWSVINEQTILIANAAALETLILGADLLINRNYFLLSERVFVKATSNQTISSYGWILASAVDTAVVAIYDFGGSYSATDLAYWSNVVYENITGVNSGVDPATDTTNWSAVAAFDPGTRAVIFDCELHLWGGVITVFQIRDDQNNDVREMIDLLNDISAKLRQGNRLIGNDCEIHCKNFTGNVFNNTLMGISRLEIGYDVVDSNGLVSDNVLKNANIKNIDGTDGTTPRAGEIVGNNLSKVDILFPAGQEAGCKFNHCNIQNPVIGPTNSEINISKDAVIEGGKLGPDGGNLIVECDQTAEGATFPNIRLKNTAFPYLDVYGVYELADGTASTWTHLESGFEGFPFDIPYKIVAKKATTFVIGTANWAGKTNRCFLHDGTTFTLNGDAQDFIICKKIDIGSGNYAIQIIQKQVQA